MDRPTLRAGIEKGLSLSSLRIKAIDAIPFEVIAA